MNTTGQTSIAGYDSSFGNFLVHTPGAFFGFGLLFWGIWKVVYLLPNLRARLAQGRAGRTLTVKFQINKKLNTERMLDFILYKAVLFETVDTNSEDEIRRITWEETDSGKWRGPPPRLEVAFNETNGFLLTVAFGIDRSRSRLSAKAAYNIFIEDLVLAKVLTAEETEKAKDTFV